MSEYVVTARKWRPMRFEDVVGQSHVTATLRNAIASGRLAHAYLFSGPRGVGKTTTARLLAKAVNCSHPVESNPDNECNMCLEITEGRSFDVLEIDGASNRGIEEIRNLRESVKYAPAKGRYKVYIIDEVHMLTKEAFNALLKTLEEPPSHVLFVFATTEIHKVPPTIVSRCQRFDFRRIAIDEIAGNLRLIAKQEGLTLDDDALLLIAKKGDGSLRDAQSMFDQAVSLCGATITHQQILQAFSIVDQDVYFRVTDLITRKDARGALDLVDELMKGGHDIKEFLAGLGEHFRNLLLAATTGRTDLIETSDVYRRRYAEESGKFSVPDLLRFQKTVAATEAGIRWSAQPRFRLEADMVQLISLRGAQEVQELIRKVDDLRKTLAGEPASPPAGSRGTPTVHGPSGPPPAASPPPQRTAAPSPSPARTKQAQPSALSEAEITTRWQEFLNEVRRQRIALGSILEAATVLGLRDGVLKLGVGDKFLASEIVKNKEAIGEFLLTIFHGRARIEVEVRPEFAHPGSAGDGDQPKPSEEHPVIAAMKRELGAEPLE